MLPLALPIVFVCELILFDIGGGVELVLQQLEDHILLGDEPEVSRLSWWWIGAWAG